MSDDCIEIVCRGADGVYRQGPDADVLDEDGRDADGNYAAELLSAVEYGDPRHLDGEELPLGAPSRSAIDAARREINSAMRLRARVIEHLRACKAYLALAEAELEQERDALALQNAERLLPLLN